MEQKILALDRSYRPLSWIHPDVAITAEYTGGVLDHLGEEIILYRGGTNRLTGKETTVATSSIIVVDGEPSMKKWNRPPVLTNDALFQRDRCVCAYCAGVFREKDLTRDHIIPVSKGGQDVWMNVVASCKPCNGLKGNIMPGEKLPHGMWSPQGSQVMDPVYVPYVPCKAEQLIMKNKKILADQMAFLMDRVANKDRSRLYQAWSAEQAAAAA
jgi:5-methylcytosine-specific restriction endonuclease McrA